MTYKTFPELTVSEYQQLYSIVMSDDDDVNKSVACVSVITGLPRWEVEELPLPEFNQANQEIALIFAVPQSEERPSNSVKIGEREYTVVYNVRKLSAGQFIDIQTFLKGNMIENLHKLFACLLIDKKTKKYIGADHEEISEQIKELKFSTINATCVFFLKLWRVSMPVIQDYLEKELKKKNLSLGALDLQVFMDGFLMPSRLQTSKT